MQRELIEGMARKSRKGRLAAAGTDEPQASAAIQKAIGDKLDEAYEVAAAYDASGNEPEWNLSPRFRRALDTMLKKASPPGSTGFTNLVTCLTIKAIMPRIDMRAHQVQIGAPFGFRTLSEEIVYPWLDQHEFQGAKSGWQTRTFERNHPYTMDFPHNISASIKVPFLTCFDEIEEHGGDAFEALTYLVFKQIEWRVRKEADRASFVRDYSALNDINRIVAMFAEHFSLPIAGSSRLPVLAIYAIYMVMMDQVGRFEGKTLRELELHSAADQRTGALGDIEVINEDETVYEGLEIKHGLPVTKAMINACARKIEAAPYPVDRYYILTTHVQCTPAPEMAVQLENLAKRLGCQIVVNGVIPTIKYYLRLLTEPKLVLPVYQDLLESERAISHEHAVAWNDILRKAGGENAEESQSLA